MPRKKKQQPKQKQAQQAQKSVSVALSPATKNRFLQDSLQLKQDWGKIRAHASSLQSLKPFLDKLIKKFQENANSPEDASLKDLYDKTMSSLLNTYQEVVFALSEYYEANDDFSQGISSFIATRKTITKEIKNERLVAQLVQPIDIKVGIWHVDLSGQYEGFKQIEKVPAEVLKKHPKDDFFACRLWNIAVYFTYNTGNSLVSDILRHRYINPHAAMTKEQRVINIDKSAMDKAVMLKAIEKYSKLAIEKIDIDSGKDAMSADQYHMYLGASANRIQARYMAYFDGDSLVKNADGKDIKAILDDFDTFEKKPIFKEPDQAHAQGLFFFNKARLAIILAYVHAVALEDDRIEPQDKRQHEEVIESNKNKFKEHLFRSASLGYMPAKIEICSHYIETQQAQSYIRDVIATGSKQHQYAQIMYLLNNNGLQDEQKTKEILALLEEVVKQEQYAEKIFSPYVHKVLGDIYSEEKQGYVSPYIKMDRQKAIKHYKMALEETNIPEFVRDRLLIDLGCLLLHDNQFQLGLELLEEAQDHGEVDAVMALAFFYLEYGSLIIKYFLETSQNQPNGKQFWEKIAIQRLMQAISYCVDATAMIANNNPGDKLLMSDENERMLVGKALRAAFSGISFVSSNNDTYFVKGIRRKCNEYLKKLPINSHFLILDEAYHEEQQKSCSSTEKASIVQQAFSQKMFHQKGIDLSTSERFLSFKSRNCGVTSFDMSIEQLQRLTAAYLSSDNQSADFNGNNLEFTPYFEAKAKFQIDILVDAYNFLGAKTIENIAFALLGIGQVLWSSGSWHYQLFAAYKNAIKTIFNALLECLNTPSSMSAETLQQLSDILVSIRKMRLDVQDEKVKETISKVLNQLDANKQQLSIASLINIIKSLDLLPKDDKHIGNFLTKLAARLKGNIKDLSFSQMSSLFHALARIDYNNENHTDLPLGKNPVICRNLIKAMLTSPMLVEHMRTRQSRVSLCQWVQGIEYFRLVQPDLFTALYRSRHFQQKYYHAYLSLEEGRPSRLQQRMQKTIAQVERKTPQQEVFCPFPCDYFVNGRIYEVKGPSHFSMNRLSDNHVSDSNQLASCDYLDNFMEGLKRLWYNVHGVQQDKAALLQQVGSIIHLMASTPQQQINQKLAALKSEQTPLRGIIAIPYTLSRIEEQKSVEAHIRTQLVKPMPQLAPNRHTFMPSLLTTSVQENTENTSQDIRSGSYQST